MTVLLALAVVAGGVAALEGLGILAIRVASRLTGAGAPWAGPGVRGALGVVVLCVVSGVAAPTGIPMLVPFALLMLAGLATGAVTVWGARAAVVDRRALALRLGILIALGAWATVWALARPTWNLCDDPVSYFPFGDSLLHGDGLAQPFSQRRIGTLGAFLPLQFFGSIPLGPYAAAFGDTLICPLLAAVALLWSSRGWAGTVVAAAGSVVAVLGAVGRINLGPSGVTVLLLVALGLIAMRSAKLEGASRLLAVGAGGAIAATILAFRLHHALVALAPLAVLVYAHPAGERLRRLGAGAAAGLIAIAGWAVASWQATGTPLFPLLGKGTINPDWPGYDDPAVSGLGTMVSRSLDLLAYADSWFVLLAVTVVCLVCVLHGRASTFVVPLGMIVLAGALVAAFPVLITTSAPEDGWRLTRPLVVAALLVLVAELARAVDEGRARWRSEAALPVALAAVAAAFLTINLGQVPWADVVARARDLGAGIGDANRFDRDPWSGVRGSYDAVRRGLPGDAVVAYTVDEPALMRGAGRTAWNLDVPGANSPAPGLPYFQGVDAKLAYLRDRGVSHVVTVDPGASVCLYRRDSWQANTTGPVRVYQLWAPYYLDWLADADLIAARPGTRTYGTLRVTPIS